MATSLKPSTGHIVNQYGAVKEISPLVFLGLSKEELELLLGGTIAGPGFIDESPYQCVIPQAIADSLNVTVGDTLHIENYKQDFKVMGIANSSSDMFTDFDARSILPIAPRFSEILSMMALPMATQETPAGISINNVMFIPWKTAYDLGGLISGVTIIPRSNTTEAQLLEIGTRIAFGIDSAVYVGYGKTIHGLSKVVSYSVKGWDVVWLLQVIAVISITNSLVGSVQRRRRDIMVYSSLGLSPKGAIFMFITESVAYAVLASVLGYLIGYALNMLLSFMVPTVAFNVSSLFIVISVSAVIAACLAGALYPSIIASRIVTPSLERKWKISTKPRGNVWDIPVPLKAPRKEVAGLLMYLSEYYTGMGALGPGYRLIGEPKIDPTDLSLTFDFNILPEELGVTVNATILAEFQDVNSYMFKLLLKLEKGEPKIWVPRSYKFIYNLRKQLFLWRSVPEPEREKYIDRARSLTSFRPQKN